MDERQAVLVASSGKERRLLPVHAEIIKAVDRLARGVFSIVSELLYSFLAISRFSYFCRVGEDIVVFVLLVARAGARSIRLDDFYYFLLFHRLDAYSRSTWRRKRKVLRYRRPGIRWDTVWARQAVSLLPGPCPG